MREIQLNGYIDEDVWFGDEITPDTLHESLYGQQNSPFTDDVHIRLNSYGGSCNAATRMHDDIRAYPGNVRITISGTAASAATVVAMAADHLDMTPGSLLMIHDPSVIAWGNEQDLIEAIGLLRACKESILNIYEARCKRPREELSAMMTATHWMDANEALDLGFVDWIVEDSPKPSITNLAEAKVHVKAWLDRRRPQPSRPQQGDDRTSFVQEKGLEVQGGTVTTSIESAPEECGPSKPDPSGTPVTQLQRRLELLMPARR